MIADLALPLLTATHQAAVACLDWVGRGDGKRADGAATAAMRAALRTVPGTGRVVIGEGAKDDAPMLYTGELLGLGGDPRWDLAVDPLEGTTACSQLAEGAVTVVAAAPAGTLLQTPGWYMDKLVVGPAAVGAIDITAPIEDNVRAVAAAQGKNPGDVRVTVLDKPRHVDLIQRLRALGCRVRLIPNGDVMAALPVLLGDGDLLAGIGGAPEGVLTACAVRSLGGDMQARLAPQSDEERALLTADGQDEGTALTLEDLVGSDDTCFVATAVTAAFPLAAPVAVGSGCETQSFVSTTAHPALVVTRRCLAAAPAERVVRLDETGVVARA
jgi:fructose-1,6-bisphosphatase II